MTGYILVTARLSPYEEKMQLNLFCTEQFHRTAKLKLYQDNMNLTQCCISSKINILSITAMASCLYGFHGGSEMWHWLMGLAYRYSSMVILLKLLLVEYIQLEPTCISVTFPLYQTGYIWFGC
jgi:hypothetical protein